MLDSNRGGGDATPHGVLNSPPLGHRRDKMDSEVCNSHADSFALATSGPVHRRPRELLASLSLKNNVVFSV